MVKRSPFGWVEAKAWDFPAIWSAIQRHHTSGHPVTPFMIATIFFEETGFCNVAQAQTTGTLGVGFGQLEVSNPEKKDFYAWMSLPTDYKQVSQLMLADNDVAVRVHCKYFQYLTSVRGLGLEGCLGGQVGSHRSYIGLFKGGASLLEKAYQANDRKLYIQALNYSRSNSSKANGIPESLFPDFWNFILPEGWFKYGF